MNSFPMFAQCALAQWQGYGQLVQERITQLWEKGQGDCVWSSSSLHVDHTYFLWWVERGCQADAGDILISVKTVTWPET